MSLLCQRCKTRIQLQHVRNWSLWEVRHCSWWTPASWELAVGASYDKPGRTQPDRSHHHVRGLKQPMGLAHEGQVGSTASELIQQTCTQALTHCDPCS